MTISNIQLRIGVYDSGEKMQILKEILNILLIMQSKDTPL